MRQAAGLNSTTFADSISTTANSSTISVSWEPVGTMTFRVARIYRQRIGRSRIRWLGSYILAIDSWFARPKCTYWDA
jgi:hypothetical protein